MAKKKNKGGGIDNIDRATMAAQYGFALAFMESDPELKKLFNKAVSKTWTADEFVAQLYNTKWYQHHSASVRNAILQETSDPATYKANVDKMYATVKDAWGGMFGSAGGVDNKTMRAWAETAQRMGWSEAQLTDQMTRGVDWVKMLNANTLGGTAAQTVDQLQQLAQNYGVNVSDKWSGRQLEKIMEGSDSVEGVTHRVQELAAQQYAAFGDRIRAGETVSEIADPYMQKMADLLELDPAQVNIDTHLIQKALTQRNKDGVPTGMTLGEFTDAVRQDRRWAYTDNAKQQVAGVTESLLKQFGVM